MERSPSIAGLLRLDTRELDDLCPLLGFVGEDLTKVSGLAYRHAAP